MSSRHWILILLLISAIGAIAVSRRSPYDVDADFGSIQDMDKINLAIPPLAAAVRAHPQANTFRVRYSIVPDPALPHEKLPLEITYDRKAKILRWSREHYYEQYDNVSETTLQKVAAKKGGVRMLLGYGCPRSFPRR
jgi:hypothetical protein